MSLESKTSHLQRLAFVVLIGVLLAAFVPAKVTHAQVPTPASYTFEECDQVKASTLRDELNRITQAVMAEEQGGMDTAATVNRNWRTLNLDAAVDAAMGTATEQVKGETGYWDRLISGWNAEKAKELTEIVASRAFTSTILSDAIILRNAMNQLSQNISDDVVEEIQVITAMSASSALLCVQAFIGDSISPTMSAVLAKDIQRKLEEINNPTDEEIGFLDIAKSKPHLLGGVGVVIVSQFAKSLGKKLAQSIGGKVVIRVLGRGVATFVPVVGWIVGVGLIVWDLWKAGEGSFPLIQDALQDEEVKQEIRKYITQQVHEELRLELPQLARTIANDVYSQWQEFRKDYARVLSLAEASTRFRGILDRTEVAEIKSLAGLVGFIENEFGTRKLKELIENGSFERLLDLSNSALKMLRSGVEPEGVIEWADLAGGLFDQVAHYEMHSFASPSDYSERAALELILALEDVELIRKLMLLQQDVRETILELPKEHIVKILYALSPEELSHLARDILKVLEPREKNILVDRILSDPGLISELGTGVVRGALLGGQDFEQRLNYVVQRIRQRPGLGTFVEMFAAIGPALSGELPFGLFWHYDGESLLNVLYGLTAVLAIYIVWRRVFPGRRQDVNVNVVLPGNQGSVGSDSDVKRIGTGKDEEESN